MRLLSTQRLLPVTALVMVIAIGVKIAALVQEMPPLGELPFQAADAMRAAGATVLPPAEAAKLPLRQDAHAVAAAAQRPAPPANQPDAKRPDAKRPDGAPAAAAAPLPAAAPAAPPAPAPTAPPTAGAAHAAASADAAAALTAAGAVPQPAADAGGPPAAPQRPALSDADKALLEDLRTRRSQIEAREQVLDQREATLGAAEKRLTERVSELAALQARLQDLEKGLKDHDEANWQGMVKTYETMRPRDAAQIFNALDKNVLIEMVDRMKPAKVAPILAAMDADRARMVTADVAARRTQSTSLAN